MVSIDIRIPFIPGAKLGMAYNQIMSETKCEWVLFLDHDVFLCNPHWYHLCERAIEQFPETGLFTCWTNHIGKTGQKNTDAPKSDSIGEHRAFARQIFEKYNEAVTEIDKASGMFLLINRSAWSKVGGFPGVEIFKEDWIFSRRLIKAGLKIRRIDGLYVYHLRDRDEGSWIEGVKTTKELRDERYANN